MKDTLCGSLHTHIIINSVSCLNGQIITTLKEIIIPASVRYIDKEAFVSCSSLEKVTFAPRDTTLYIHPTAFNGTPWKNSLPPDMVFSYVGFSIEDNTVDGHLIIPDYVNVVGDCALAKIDEADLKSIIVKDSNCLFDSSYPLKNFKGTIYAPEGSKAQKYAELCGINFETLDKAPYLTVPLRDLIFGEDVEGISPYWENFYNVASITVVNPECKFEYEIVPSGFTGVICGYEGSPAEEYAKRENYPFRPITASPFYDTISKTITTTTAPARDHNCTVHGNNGCTCRNYGFCCSRRNSAARNSCFDH